MAIEGAQPTPPARNALDAARYAGWSTVWLLQASLEGPICPQRQRAWRDVVASVGERQAGRGAPSTLQQSLHECGSDQVTAGRQNGNEPGQRVARQRGALAADDPRA